MTKETQTQAIAEPFKFKNAALLNRLFEMTKASYYATACDTLVLAEMAIVGLERENAVLRAEFERLAAQAEPAPAPFAKDSWQHAVDNHLSALGKISEEFLNSHEAVRWLLEFTSTLPVDASAPVGEVRLLTSKDIADVRETLWRNTQVNLSDLHAEDAAKAFQRKFCEVNGLTVKEQS